MFVKLKSGVIYLLEQAKSNSRFVFLIHGVAVAVGTLALVVAFICAKDKSAYPSMVMALGGSGAGAAAGRWMTKKNDADTPDTPDADAKA